MYYQFLTEDRSGEALIEIVMEKIKQTYPDLIYRIKPFGGIVHFPKGNTAKEIKTKKLLNSLPTYLRGFDKSLQNISAVIVVVLDNDDRDAAEFQKELENVAMQHMIAIDHVFCLAIEEIEAWLLGDEDAVRAAYPQARLSALHSYRQDSICGTWETLADAVYKGGRQKMKKQPFSERGRIKNEWARKIGAHLDLTQNRSPSFNGFLFEIYKRAVIA